MTTASITSRFRDRIASDHKEPGSHAPRRNAPAPAPRHSQSTPPQLQLPGVRGPRRDCPFLSLSVQCGTTPDLTTPTTSRTSSSNAATRSASMFDASVAGESSRQRDRDHVVGLLRGLLHPKVRLVDLERGVQGDEIRRDRERTTGFIHIMFTRYCILLSRVLGLVRAKMRPTHREDPDRDRSICLVRR
jgi:hypothetical protein